MVPPSPAPVPGVKKMKSIEIEKWDLENWEDLMHDQNEPGPEEYDNVMIWGNVWQGGARNPHDSDIIKCLGEFTEADTFLIDVTYNPIDLSYYFELFEVIASMKKLTNVQVLFPDAIVPMASIVPAMFEKSPPFQFDSISAGFLREDSLYDFLLTARDVLSNLSYLTIMPGYGGRGLDFVCSEKTLELLAEIVKTNKKIKSFVLYGPGHSDTTMEMFARAFSDHLHLDNLYIGGAATLDCATDYKRELKCMDVVNRCKQNRRLAFPEEMISPLAI